MMSISSIEYSRMLHKWEATGRSHLTEEKIKQLVEAMKIYNYIQGAKDEWDKYHGMFAITNDAKEIKDAEERIKKKVCRYLQKKMMKWNIPIALKEG